MFPGQQGATWSSQLWQPRLGIKLLGAPSTEKWPKGVDFCVTSQRIGVISLFFAQSTERAQSGHINRPCHPCSSSLSVSISEFTQTLLQLILYSRLLYSVYSFSYENEKQPTQRLRTVYGCKAKWSWAPAGAATNPAGRAPPSRGGGLSLL